MSLDLYVVRSQPPLDAKEFLAALATLATRMNGFSAFAINNDLAPTGYWWNSPRVMLSFEDACDPESEPAEMRSPYLVVNSRRGAWPWIKFTAVELARILGGNVFDPQQGELYEELYVEYTLEQLRALHDEDVAGRTLDSSYHATLDPSRHDLGAVVDHVCAIGRERFGADVPPLKPGIVNWSHNFTESAIDVSSSSVDHDLIIRGPAASLETHAFATALATRLELELRRVDEYC